MDKMDKANLKKSLNYCLDYSQTPTTGKTMELTLLLHGINNYNKNKNPDPNYHRRGCHSIIRFYKWPSIQKWLFKGSEVLHVSMYGKL